MNKTSSSVNPRLGVPNGLDPGTHQVKMQRAKETHGSRLLLQAAGKLRGTLEPRRAL